MDPARNETFLRNIYRKGPFERQGFCVHATGVPLHEWEGYDYTLSEAPIREWVPWVVENYERQVRMLDEVGDDSVPVAKLGTGTQLYAAAFGCPVHTYEDTNPCALPLVRAAEEADALEVPDIWGTRELSRVFELGKLVQAELGEDAYIGPCDVQSGFDTASLIWNKEDFLLAMTDEAKLVIACEGTYMMSQHHDMAAYRDLVMRQSLVVSTVPELARRHMSFAAGIWTCVGSGSGSFSFTDAKANHRDPKRHERAMANALAVSDDYAWQWSHSSRFVWYEGGKKPYPPLVRAYQRANERGHEPYDLEWAPDIEFDRKDYTKFDEEAAARNKGTWERLTAEGYKVVMTLPEYWRFRYDPEFLGRFSNIGEFKNRWAGHSWLLVSSKTCWQSQGIPLVGDSFYGMEVTIPGDIDLETNDVFLAFGAWGNNAVNIYFNNHWVGYLPKNPVCLLTKKGGVVKPGEKHAVVLGFIHKEGPGGLAGDVKIVTRRKLKD